MTERSKKTSLFIKIFLGVFFINLASNLLFVYIIYIGYEGVIAQIRPFLSIDVYDIWLVSVPYLLLIILASTLFTALFANKIMKPLRKLLEAMRQIKRGNLNVKIESIAEDEIGDIAHEFNAMIARLKEAKEALEDEKMILEVRVKARTKELEELAQGLEEKVKERTKELQGRIDQLERFHQLTVGREIKMMELKKELERAHRKNKEN